MTLYVIELRWSNHDPWHRPSDPHGPYKTLSVARERAKGLAVKVPSGQWRAVKA